ncbi:MAG: M3 family oligoendopeptidase [Cellulosilyticaceae bacterium]
MGFNEFQYTRPDYEAYKTQVNHYIAQLRGAQTADVVLEAFHGVNVLKNTLGTMESLSYIRSSINTNDAFYEEEMNYWSEYQPLFQELDTDFFRAVIESPFRADIEAVTGSQYMRLLECQLQTFAPEIIGELQEENRLVLEYNKLIASAQIPFQGKVHNLSGMMPYMIHKERQVREDASVAYFHFFEEQEEALDRLYDELVKVRDRMAKKLGYENYIPLAYKRLNRTDYDASKVAVFREQVLKYIVPAASKLYERQQVRLGLESLRYFDLGYEFETGNATPKGDAAYILDMGHKMYGELSKETAAFFEFMVENQAMDLETKPGKQAGGYCTYINDYSSPFIFSNFNGTSGDVDVLTHEAGHAFQVYRSRGIEQPEVIWPTLESCEIHSMSMEFITWPWMDLFFKEETEKYKFSHLGSAITFIPYGVTVDAFQHFVYEHPEVSPAERKAAWRELEKIYLPHKNYEGCEILERGGWWYKQGHIFKSPFYYIDYTLAQICALQFWKKFQDDREGAWKDYLRLCDQGGTQSFLELVDTANLISPFNEHCIVSVIEEITNWLDAVDDQTL